MTCQQYSSYIANICKYVCIKLLYLANTIRAMHSLKIKERVCPVQHVGTSCIASCMGYHSILGCIKLTVILKIYHIT